MRLILFLLAFTLSAQPRWNFEVRQLTSGPNHHFFGYIGHVQNIPWNGSGRSIAMLRTTFQDHMPKRGETADIVLYDTRNGRTEAIAKTAAWNFQQGTMLYWNPLAPEHQIFFNDRDPKSGKVFTVLFDVRTKRRLREFRFDDTPVGNSGVQQNGGRFLAMNYGRLARLRPVTGYPESFDWTGGTNAPEDDGLFLIDARSGVKRLLVSFRKLADSIRSERPDVDSIPLFLNHTLWNRDGDRIYFYLRGAFDDGEKRIDIPFTIRPDGTGLTRQKFVGGHPEWAEGKLLVGLLDGRQVLYDVDRQEITGFLGTRESIPQPGADIAVSPDGKWFVNGFRKGAANLYAILNRADGSWRHTQTFPIAGWTTGDLRVDPAPAWNRQSNQILFPGIAPDGTRQSFLLTLLPDSAPRR
jgi:hypothetical protein